MVWSHWRGRVEEPGKRFCQDFVVEADGEIDVIHLGYHPRKSDVDQSCTCGNVDAEIVVAAIEPDLEKVTEAVTGDVHESRCERSTVLVES